MASLQTFVSNVWHLFKIAINKQFPLSKNKLILLFAVLIFSNAGAVIRYVTPAGAGLQNGTNWANAFPGTSLQATINASAPGDEVWVMSGTYFTTTLASRSIYFSMLNGVAIYGSFNGTETALSQRSFTCGFTSVLSAEIGAPGIADNSYHVISNGSLNNTAVLDGFTITGGNANFDIPGNDSRSHGGGMMNLASNGGLCSPTVRNCLFINNTAVFGGGMFNNGFNTGNANPVITNCIFYQNNATQGGGGMDNFGYGGNASPVITNSVFYGNTATARAGAMYCWGGGNGNASPVILNSTFVNNAAVDGGGLICDRTNFASGNSGIATLVVRNSIFWGNTASGTGPQFYTLGGGGFAATYTLIDITNQNPPHTITGPGTGNIFAAPSFINIADADGADNCWLTSDDGLQLQFASAGIDAGDNTGVPAFDIRNYNRIANSVVDMGAYEFNSAVLPVRLLSFAGKPYGKTNRLGWATATETDNVLFEVQRSDDGSLFEKIGERAGAGQSQTVKQYQFTDYYVNRSRYYYRLKQIDKDGRFSFSSIISIEGKEQDEITVMPNPVQTKALLIIPEKFIGEKFSLFNTNGQLIMVLMPNRQTVEIDLTGKAPGLYILKGRQPGLKIKILKTGQ
jgi:hypothetical protein